MRKSAKSMADIFTSTERPAAAAAPAAEEEAYVKTSCFFSPDQLVYLDGQTGEIRKASRKALKRTAILRAIVQAFADYQVDLSACSTEAELTMALKKCIPIIKGKHRLNPH